MSSTKPKTILIIDDSRVSRMFARQYILELHPDWYIGEADSGEAALEALQAVAADLVLLDVNMPGIGGLETALQLRQRYPALPICIISANVQHATQDRAAAMGVGFAAKPITAERIAQIISVVEDA